MEKRKLALVTGASSGIGEALCSLLVAKGHGCVAIARRIDKLKRLQERLGGKNNLIAHPCDVSSAEEVKKVSTLLQAEGYIPDLFFLNAGTAGESAIDPEEGFLEHHRTVFAVNYFGVLNWVDAWQSLLSENGSMTFLVTSSCNAIFAPPRGSAYAASKAAISKAFEALDLQHSAQGTRFLISYAGPVATAGLAGKWPFTWTPERMAHSLLQQALSGKARRHPSLFYGSLCSLLRHLPYRVTRKLL